MSLYEGLKNHNTQNTHAMACLDKNHTLEFNKTRYTAIKNKAEDAHFAATQFETHKILGHSQQPVQTQSALHSI